MTDKAGGDERHHYDAVPPLSISATDHPHVAVRLWHSEHLEVVSEEASSLDLSHLAVTLAGFTHDDVEMLRGAAVNWPYENRHRFAELADRIAALLPPTTGERE